MKPLTPVKAVALTALATTLALPAAKAQSPNPAGSVPSVSAPTPSASPSVSVPLSAGVTPISFDVDQGSVRDILAMMFKQEHLDYVIEPGVSGTVNVHLNSVPFDKALTTLLEATSPPLEYTVRDGVYHIRPHALHSVEAIPAAPRQVQIKFEWVSSASTLNAAPDRSVDALTIIAEEGRMAQVSSQHLRNGAGGKETISVLVHLKPGGVVGLDITEHSDTTAPVGGTKSDSAETTVRVKDGETGTVRFQVSKQGGQSSERVLFVTPAIIRPAADGSAEPRPAPLRDGDIVYYKVNPVTVPHYEGASESENEKAIATLLAERATKLAGGAMLNHPDILRLDARIAELQLGQRAGETGTMKRRPVNPVPDKTP